MKRKLGIGIIGCGGISETHIACWNAVPEARIVAVADISEERARGGATMAGGVKWYTDYKGLLKRDDVVAVDICTPPFLHAEEIIASAEAGKHILCEKPLTVNLDNAEKAIEAAKKAGVKLMTAFCLRFTPGSRKIKEVIQRRELGEPVKACSRLFWKKEWLRKPQNWYWDPKKSGGLTIEGLIHLCDYLPWLFGPVERVYAEAGTFHYTKYKPTIPDDQIVITLRFENNAIGVMEGSGVLPEGFPYSRDYYFFTNGAILVEGNEKPICIFKGFEEAEITEIPPPVDIPGGEIHWYELKHFAECLLEDKTPECTGEDGKAALEVAWAAIKSFQTRKPVNLPLRKPYPSY